MSAFGRIEEEYEARITALEEQLAEAVRLRDKFEGALATANSAARRRGERIAALEAENAALRESNVDLIARNAQAEAENATLREDKERLVNIARGCHDYGGGYKVEHQIEIYHHGIQTVINALEAATKSDSLQLKVLESVGVDAARKET